MSEPFGAHTRTTQHIDRLLARLSAGDLAARDAIIDRSVRRLAELAHRQLRRFPAVARWEQTDDVVQGAAMRLHRALADVAPADARNYLCLAAATIRRELIDLKRRLFGPEGAAGHHVTPRINPDAAPVADDQPQPDVIVGWSELHEKVSTLPEKLREVFDLVWYDQLTHEEAAEALGVSTKYVQRQLREAKLELATILGDFGT